MFKLLYRKFIQDSVYQISSESSGFCGRYDKNIVVCFYRFTVYIVGTRNNRRGAVTSLNFLSMVTEYTPPCCRAIKLCLVGICVAECTFQVQQ